MDSIAINKLIRSEVWPVLRMLGFTRFEPRNAWRDRGPLIDVVNFQSMGVSLADAIGCTTYSFAVNLGVYVPGSAHERGVRRDTAGLRPNEHQCPFRQQLQKRTRIDGFERVDIFYIDEQGLTTSPVFREVVALLQVQAELWFQRYANLGSVVRSIMVDRTRPLSAAESDQLATLQLLRHAQSPDVVPAIECVEAINGLVGAKLDIYSELLHPPDAIESECLRIRELLDVVRDSIPEMHGPLFDRPWRPRIVAEVDHLPTIAARESLWPYLRERGFIEFTDRLAHRISDVGIEVVALAPMPPVERRQHRYPAGLFRVGIGVFWPLLAEHKVRKNRRGESRPTLGECHLQMWLMPAAPAVAGGPTCFDSAESAQTALAAAEAWFGLCRDRDALSHLLNTADLEILARYPTMRGQGGCASVNRALLHVLLSESTEGRASRIRAAHNAVKHYVDHLQARFRSWVEVVEARL